MWKKFWKSSIGWRVIMFWFLNFPPFCYYFWNISTLQDAISPKAIELLQQFFTFVSITSRSFKIIYLFCHNLKFKFCCQSCNVIFPSKTVKIEKQKTSDFLEYKVLPFCKVWVQTNEKCKSSSKDALLGVLYAHRG